MCGCKYNTNDGMIIEFHKNGHSYFMMAPCPPWEIEDIRNMAVEDSEKFRDKPSARALYDEIPNLKPFDFADFLHVCRADEIWDYNMLPDEFEIDYYFRFVDRLLLTLPEQIREPSQHGNWRLIALLKDRGEKEMRAMLALG